MTELRAHIPSSAPKVLVFAAVTIALTLVLATLVGNISLRDRHKYHALFTDATGVFKGDRVRLSGVQVGRIDRIEMVKSGERRLARLTFSVDSDVPVLRSAELSLRYENIVGQRYLAIKEEVGAGGLMPVGGTFSERQTTPALSLTQLFNGFQPLFQALDPKQVNTFSFQIVRALQGEASSAANLLEATADVTSTLADKDAVIGRVVNNLGDVLDTLGTRDVELSKLIREFRDLMVGLARDRDDVSRALPSLAGLLTDSAELVRDVRQPLKANLHSLRGVATQLNKDRNVLNELLQTMPKDMRTLIRTASYGSWFTFYICGLDVQIQLLDGTVQLGGAGIAANEKDTVCGMGPGE